jgi:hypothetical protein
MEKLKTVINIVLSVVRQFMFRANMFGRMKEDMVFIKIIQVTQVVMDSLIDVKSAGRLK